MYAGILLACMYVLKYTQVLVYMYSVCVCVRICSCMCVMYTCAHVLLDMYRYNLIGAHLVYMCKCISHVKHVLDL